MKIDYNDPPHNKPGHPELGTFWRERKPYDYRVVEVIAYHDDDGYVLIRYAGRITKARADRFGRDYKLERV